MNRLQSLRKHLLVTLNPETRPQADLIHREIDYQHPVFDSKAIQYNRIYLKFRQKRGILCGEDGPYFREDEEIGCFRDKEPDIDTSEQPDKGGCTCQAQGTEELQGNPPDSRV